MLLAATPKNLSDLKLLRNSYRFMTVNSKDVIISGKT